MKKGFLKQYHGAKQTKKTELYTTQRDAKTVCSSVIYLGEVGGGAGSQFQRAVQHGIHTQSIIYHARCPN